MKCTVSWKTKTSPEFIGRVTKLTAFDPTTGKYKQYSYPVPDGDIICDYCGEEVTEEPFAVLHIGTGYVPCTACRISRGIVPGQLEYEEKHGRSRSDG